MALRGVLMLWLCGVAGASFAATAPELSTIVVPIRASLAPLLPQIERNVPPKIAEARNERGFTVRYDIERDPIDLKMIGAGLHATTTAHYKLEVCRLGRCLECDARGRRSAMAVALHAHLAWDAQWRIRSKTTARPAQTVAACELPLLRLDVDRYIKPAVDAQLRDIAKQIDQRMPFMANMRPEAQKIWNSLQAPIELSPRTWLVLEPIQVALAPITGNGLQVTSTLALRARTRVVVGEKPQVALKPLPALATFAANGAGIRVPLDLELSYADAGRIFTEHFGARTYRINGRDLRVAAIRVAPGAKGKLVVEAEIDYRGGLLKNYRGPVVLEGTPRFDPATNSIVIPDLDYTLDPKRRSLFARTADRIAHDSVRARLREQAHFPIAQQLAEARAEVTRGLNRTLAPGVQLRGRADTIAPTSVTAGANAVVVHVVATGAAEVDLR